MKYFILSCLTVVVACSLTPQASFAEGWGDIKGRVIVDGTPPTTSPLVTKGQAVKDAAICAVNDINDESLVYDPATKGLGNCFVYLYSRRDVDVHPDLKVPANPEVLFDQKGCKFIPHALVVRTDQVVKCISNDGCGHNVHTYPLKNDAFNQIVAPNDNVGVNVKHTEKELLPMQVKCDIHPWMTAYWFVVDHPYATVTEPDGSFTIKGLPEGEHTFRVWHERVGYIERGLDVEVVDGKMITISPIEVDADDLEE